jgi:uncharacterized membrane protein YphA (DoxX/SURF4 family)
MFDDRPMDPRTLALMRVAVCGWATWSLGFRAPWRAGSMTSAMSELPAQLWDPIGVLAPRSTPPGDALVAAVTVVGLVAGLASVVGVRTRVSTVVLAACFLWLATLEQSWGRLQENLNLPSLVLALLAVSPCGDAWSVDARGGPALPHARYRWSTDAIAMAVGAMLFVAGVSKLRTSGWAWVASDNLRNILLGTNLGVATREPGAIALWLAARPELCQVAAGFAVVAELAVLPLLFVRRLWARGVAAAAALALFGGFAVLLHVPQLQHVLPMLAFFDWVALGRRFRGET